MGIKDRDKLVIIAQAYFHLKGEFSSSDIYNFIKENNFGFRSEPTVSQVGAFISRSRKFEKARVENNRNIYKVKAK